jgi:hypothetical protein
VAVELIARALSACPSAQVGGALGSLKASAPVSLIAILQH